MNTWKRKALTTLAVPLLAVPSAIGVYSFLEPLSGAVAAGMAATGFELLYVGVNVLSLSPQLQRYARNVALAAVLVAILMNTIAHYGNHPAWDLGLMTIALIASAPLATLAYAVSVLLHKLSEEDRTVSSTAINLGLREQETTRRETDVTSREQAADKRMASADNYLRQCETEMTRRLAELTSREQAPAKIEQVEYIRVASYELTWQDFERIAKRLTSDAPSMSSLRRIVASVKEE